MTRLISRKKAKRIEEKSEFLGGIKNDFDNDVKEEKRKAWELCKSIACHEDILDLFWEDLSKMGIVGGKKLAQSIYLAFTTRLFKHPVPMLIKGQSGAGKSFVPMNVLPFFPKSAYCDLTSSSEKALIYSKETFKNRFVVYYEVPGVKSDFQDYLIRTLISEGRIVYEVKGRRIEKEGPTGFLTTTIRISLNPQNENRFLSFWPNDSPKQTKRILLAIAEQCNSEEEQTIGVDLIKWQAFQTWLELNRQWVVFPYAEALAKLIDPQAIRLRRDFRQVLTMIKAHALIHQKNRERNSNGAIAATLKDYSAVYRLLARPISEALGLAVPKRIRETVDAVKDIIERRESGKKRSVLLTELARKLEIDQPTVTYYLALAKDKGYLRILEGKRGTQTRIVLGDPMPLDTYILPDADVLRGRPKA